MNTSKGKSDDSKEQVQLWQKKTTEEMIKIEKSYKAESFFGNSDTTWDKSREKTFKVSVFGLTIFNKKETLDINYENKNNGIGFKK